MSLDAYALCATLPASFSEWQRSIDGLGFGSVLHARRDITEHRGPLPATWRDHEVGFEFYPSPVQDLTDTYDDIDFQGIWPHVFAFHFATLPGCIGAWIALTGLVTLTEGRAFDAQEGLVLDPVQARRYTQDTGDNFDATLAKLGGSATGRH